jgi:hypothetical protein
VEKKPHAGKEDVHPQNEFNGLILNWCIGGCWFTPVKKFRKLKCLWFLLRAMVGILLLGKGQ